MAKKRSPFIVKTTLEGDRPAVRVEAPGCVVTIRSGHVDVDGKEVTSVGVSADGNRFAGESWWCKEDVISPSGINVRVVRNKDTDVK